MTADAGNVNQCSGAEHLQSIVHKWPPVSSLSLCIFSYFHRSTFKIVDAFSPKPLREEMMICEGRNFFDLRLAGTRMHPHEEGVLCNVVTCHRATLNQCV